MIETHAHLYDEAFDADRKQVIERAKAAGVEAIILPNVDRESFPRMIDLENEYPGFCYAAIGLHPTSVAENFRDELAHVEEQLESRKYTAVGEIGIDLYWDKSFIKEQIKAFQIQVEWSLKYNLPIIIHVRNSYRETIDALLPYKGKGLKGVFHCFTGTDKEAEEIFELGDFLLGIGGVVTFKNGGVAENLQNIPLDKLVLETDSPYLSPVPYRGKRNESAYLTLIVDKLADIYAVSSTDIIAATSKNAKQLFSL